MEFAIGLRKEDEKFYLCLEKRDIRLGENEYLMLRIIFEMAQGNHRLSRDELKDLRN